MNQQSLFSRLISSDKGSSILIAVILVSTVLVAICNLAIPDGSIFHISTYTVTLLGKYLAFALLALALDLVWGYCGILSLGHSAFFALGGYAMGMYLMRQIGDRGVYGNAELPDFMVFLNYDSLPWFWHGFDMFWFSLVMVVLVPGILAYVFGWLAFRSRVTGVYLSIMTQALTYALWQAFLLNELGFGGNNGLTDFKDIVGFSLQSDATRVSLFVISALILIAAFVACRYIVTSKLGRIVVAIRDAEDRSRFVGYKVENYKLWVFVFSAMLAGIAGALYVPQVGIINPDEFKPLNSIELVIWVAIGGRATLYGAITGAITVNYAKTYFTSAWPDYWPYLLGFVFVLVTIFLPKGITGLINLLRKNKSSTNDSDDGDVNESQQTKAQPS